MLEKKWQSFGKDLTEARSLVFAEIGSVNTEKKKRNLFNVD